MYFRKLFLFILYPSALLDKTINSFLLNLYKPKTNPLIVTKLVIIVMVSFLGPLSVELNTELPKILMKFYPQCSVQLIPASFFSVDSFFKSKDSLPSMQRSSVVYIFKCADCNASYVGQTSQQLDQEPAKQTFGNFLQKW